MIVARSILLPFLSRTSISLSFRGDRSFQSSLKSPQQSDNEEMTWADTWDDILKGGSSRWKVEDESFKKGALQNILKHVGGNDSNISIFCPMAGDDSFVPIAWKQGHSVASMDLVPAAVETMRRRFGNDDKDWTMVELPNNVVVWKHASGRANLYQGDILKHVPELKQSFDAIYDKDAFGALELNMRHDYCQRLAEYTKPEGVLYTEVKYNKDKTGGPPFSVEATDLTQADNFGNRFDYVESLGEVYPFPGSTGMKQMGHVFRRRSE